MPHASDTDVLSVLTQRRLVFYRETGPSVPKESVHQWPILFSAKLHISLKATLFALHFTAAMDSGGVWGGVWGGCLSLEKLFRPSARVGLGWSFFFYFSVCHLRNTSMSVSSPGRLHTRTMWKTTRRSTLKPPPPTNTIPFPFTPPTLGGKATEPPALSLLAGFREPFKVKPTGDYCLCRARFFFPFLVFLHHSCQR